jgi:hypothetical protein
MELMQRFTFEFLLHSFSLQMRGYKCEEDAMVGEVTVQIIYLDTWLWVAATTLATRMMLLPILVYQMKETALLNGGFFVSLFSGIMQTP